MNLLHILTVLVVFFAFAISNSSYGNNLIKVGGVIVPPTFAAILREGMPLPVYLTTESDIVAYASKEQVATATVQLKGNSIVLLGIDFSNNETSALISDEYIENTRKLGNRIFDNDGNIIIDATSNIRLDFSKLFLKIKIPKKEFSAKKIKRSQELGESSINEVTGTVKYNLGISGVNVNKKVNNDNFANYANVNSIVSYGVNHVNLDMSFNGQGSSSNGELHRVMFERDFNNKFSVGMLSGWDLQSLGQVSGVNANRIYGASYGNQSNTSLVDGSLSITPIYAFLPAEGEVRILKDGKLVSIQNVPIGNHELNTKMLPSGVYDVDVEVYVDGNLISSNKQRINKTVIGSRNSGELKWQIWGGAVQPTNILEDKKNSLPNMTHLLGGSISTNFEDMYLSGSSYLYNDVAVIETNTSYLANNYIDFSLSTFNATDSSWRLIGNTNVRIADIGTLWFGYENSNIGDEIYMYESSNYSYGVNLNLSKWIHRGGNISLSKRINKTLNSDSLYIDYYQHVYSGEYGTLSLRASYQDDSGYSNKSIALDYSVPFGNIFSLGMSRNHMGTTTADLGASKMFNTGIVRYASLNASKAISNGESNGDFSTTGNASYKTKYNEGNVSVNRTNQGDWNTNIVSNGTLAFSNNTIAASGSNNGDAGIVIKTGLDKQATMIARVNNSEFKLTGGQNLIPIAAYQRYSLELMNSRDTKDSYDFDNSKKTIVLYPGNIAVFDMQNSVKELITVFGVIKAEDGSVLANARVNNHIGSTMTGADGDFVIDVDVRYPTVTFSTLDQHCEADLDIGDAAGATWVGDVVCKGLTTYASN